jgi:hypothetical protein
MEEVDWGLVRVLDRFHSGRESKEERLSSAYRPQFVLVLVAKLILA